MTTAAVHRTLTGVWLDRLRFMLALAIVWAGLHYLVEGRIVPRGTGRPLVLVNAIGGALGGLLVIGVLWGGAALATLLTAARDARKPLLILGLALALWAWGGGRQSGTMDDWLIFCHPSRGDPTAGPYLLLLADYAYLLIGVAGGYAIATTLAARARGDVSTPAWLGFQALTQRPAQGVAALAITTVIGGIVMFFAPGAAAGWTFRGQAQFAALAGLAAGTYVTGLVVKRPPLVWLWLAPILLGVIGLLGAAADPALGLPAVDKELDIIPAWGLVRALPVELVGVGLVAILWILPRGPHGKESQDGR